MASLYRSRNGKTVHHATCAKIGASVPWLWADNLTDDEIGEGMLVGGLEQCSICRPLDKVRAARDRSLGMLRRGGPK